MDELLARIEQQNLEKDAEMAARQTRDDVVAVHEARLAEHEAYAARERAAAEQRANFVPPTEDQLMDQERELDRQLEFERSLQRGGGAGMRGGSRGAYGGNKQLHNGFEKENRGKISLLPHGALPPRTQGGASSVRGGPSPSVANSITPSERLRRPVHFTHMMSDRGGTRQATQIDAHLAPMSGIREQMRRAGIQPKDHHRENRQHLKQLAAEVKHSRQAKVDAEHTRRQRDVELREHSEAQARKALDLDDLMDDSAAPRPQRAASAGRRSVRPAPSGQFDNLPPPEPRAHEPGAVPNYLRRRKAEWQAQAEEEARRRALEEECPPGLRLVGAEEKSRILEKLSEERVKAQLELRSLPFVIRTNASQQKKDALEARLEQIDGAEKEYMKEKVFVPADM